MGKLAYEHPDNRACYPLRLCHNKDKQTLLQDFTFAVNYDPAQN